MKDEIQVVTKLGFSNLSLSKPRSAQINTKSLAVFSVQFSPRV